MARGRRPDPDALQELKGRPGKRAPRAPSAATAASGSVQPSVRLKAAALRVWNQVAPGLDEMRFLRATDAGALTRYCQDLAIYWEITRRLATAGKHTYETESLHGRMRRINPDFNIQERLAARLSAAEDRFGLTPAARYQVMYRIANAPPVQPVSSSDELPLAPPSTPIGVLNGPQTIN